MKNKLIYIVPVILIIILTTGIIIKNNKTEKAVTTTNKSDQINQDSEIKEFKIEAFRFSYNPTTVKVKKGDRVKLVINNLDTLHGIRIPELNLSGNDSVEFTTDRIGEFRWYCNNYCGQNHRQMQGTLIIE